jgi:predicted ester cyclase
VRGTNDGELDGMPPTGRKVEVRGISIDRFDNDGRIVETWDNWDRAGFMEQLGLMPAMAGQAG